MAKPKILDEDFVTIRDDVDIADVGARELDLDFDDEGFSANGLHVPTVQLIRHALGVMTLEAADDANESLEQLRSIKGRATPAETQNCFIKQARAQALARVKTSIDCQVAMAKREFIEDLNAAIETAIKQGRRVAADLCIATEGEVEDIGARHDEMIREAQGKISPRSGYARTGSHTTVGWKRKFN